MQIRVLSVGQLQTNCYLIWNEGSPDCFIIDPGDDADFITTEILSLKLNPKAILLTHGHYDHCLGCLELKLNFDIPIYLDPKDLFLYRKRRQFKQPPTLPFENLPVRQAGWNLKTCPPNRRIENFFTVIPTPGHTPGSVCFYHAPHLFVGDTLKLLRSFPSNTLVYPGHEETPIALSNLKPVL